jgi:hypothetical protein
MTTTNIELIYRVIKNSITTVADVRLVGRSTIDVVELMSLLDEMSRNSAQSVVSVLEHPTL